MIVEKDTGSHHSPNHTIKKTLMICLDPRDLNEALEREPYHTHSVDEITAKLQGMTVFTIVDFKKGYWMVVLHPDSFQSCIQKGNTHSSCRYSQSCNPYGSRGQHQIANHSS